jgi:flagellar basal body-associated protein FliL
MKKMYKGISLIALIITIIVVIILASAVILGIMLNNPLDSAKKSRFMANFKNVDQAVGVYAMSKLSEDNISYKFPVKGKLTESEKIDIQKNVPTLADKILELNPDKSLDDVNLYHIDETQIGAESLYQNKNKGYLIDIDTRQIYDYEGEYFNGLRWHTTDSGVKENATNPAESTIFPINQEGTYKITVNAGSQAVWLQVITENLVIPVGSSVTFSFQTSNDKINWNPEVYRIEDASNSQYLLLKIKLIANEKGQCPSLDYAKILFKSLSQTSYTVSVQDVANVEQINNAWRLTSSSGKITQIATFTGETLINNVRIPITTKKADGSETTELASDNTSSSTIKIYVSSNGTDWEPYVEGSTNAYKYLKIETQTIKENSTDDVTIGKVQINTKVAVTLDSAKQWITYKTQYYFVDATDVGKWLSIEKDEQLADKTKIEYSFTKSNDSKIWTPYSTNILENGDSRYLKVKIDFEKESEDITDEAKLNDLIVNYEVGGQKTSKSMKTDDLIVLSQDLGGGRWEIVTSNIQKEIKYIQYKKSTDSVFKSEIGNRITVTENATYNIKVTYEDGSVSAVKQVIIDKIASLSITLAYSSTTFTQSPVTTTITATGTGGVNIVKYESGEWNVDYFKNNGKIPANNVITSNTNSVYTIYVKDNAGNEKIAYSRINNIIEPAVYKGTLKTDKGLVEYIRDNDIENGKYDLTINGVTYNIELYNFYNDMIYDKPSSLGDNIADSSTLIVKYHKNLKIESGGNITSQVRKKGMYICVNGTLNNYGTISMTARGAIAAGQNVYLYKNDNNTYAYVPAVGASGGGRVYRSSDGETNGIKGGNGTNRQTGGGGSGSACRWASATSYSGAGAAGTSYSGGSGGGGCSARNSGSWYADSAAANGGAGGNGLTRRDNSTAYHAGGGAGNNGGLGSVNNSLTTYIKGQDGTGGLLILYADTLINNSTISSNGCIGGGDAYHAEGGSSGAGSINIFLKDNISQGTLTAISPSNYEGGAGGDGSISVTKIN